MGVKHYLKVTLAALAWAAIALLIAFGAAGIIATMDPPPGTDRPELTAEGDAAIGPALDRVTGDLQALADEVDALGSTARDALGRVVGGDAEALAAAIEQGDAQVARVESLSSALDASLAEVPFTGEDWALHVSADQRRRYEQLALTAGVTAGLATDWQRFTGRSLDAAQLLAMLERHDEETAAAARLGTQGKYADALDQLGASDLTVAELRALSGRLAGTTDVTTLTAWIDRNAAYDTALRGLYEALVASDARLTPAVEKAVAREAQARAALPEDTRALVVILSDVAQGGLNDAVIRIEEARGALADALELQEQLREGASPAPA